MKLHQLDKYQQQYDVIDLWVKKVNHSQFAPATKYNCAEIFSFMKD